MSAFEENTSISPSTNNGKASVSSSEVSKEEANVILASILKCTKDQKWLDNEHHFIVNTKIDSEYNVNIHNHSKVLVNDYILSYLHDKSCSDICMKSNYVNDNVNTRNHSKVSVNDYLLSYLHNKICSDICIKSNSLNDMY